MVVGVMQNGQSYTATHQEPVWRDRADFIIAADISQDADGSEWEQLWSRQIDESRFELCCIPFFAFDLALGDVIEVGPHAGRQYVVRRVVEPSGHYTFRVWFGDSQHPAARDEVVEELTLLAQALEWSSKNLLAVDAADEEQAQRVADFLAERERLGHLKVETGRTA